MIRGGCLCGGIRYEISGEVAEMSFCHCQMCQRIHGTPFGSYAKIHPQQHRFTRGEELIAFNEHAHRSLSLIPYTEWFGGASENPPSRFVHKTGKILAIMGSFGWGGGGSTPHNW